ncbi:LOW QUALITY PROTEIN: baculoviral IAP repeat-containing protein 1 [Spea bombifrons]|uniref:LOW QUALITY PROTEIN: baculoviral IAP repeat-containing protein 1 n=1 Tax=Spea bombifrons TaxID=233779 RepID=UPI00234A2F7F|nr:LOW QUALITY PROTEIN: baculoviral IAP repeat-containing protein 1 [Spea bombifrons]
MASGMPNDEEVDVMSIKEFDPVEMEKKMSFLNIDFHQCAAEQNEKHAAIRQQLGNKYNFEMRNEVRRLKSFYTFKKLSSWCPKLMAAAGFFFTGVELSVQCFCCGLVFCTASLSTPPYEDHIKHNPTCAFIRGKDVGNISKYDMRVQLPEHNQEKLGEFIEEEIRLTSFVGWPFYAKIPSDILAKAGFFFTGKKDTVQCFSCLGCLGNWEENDDPWREHAKWFPECKYLRSKKTPEEIRLYAKYYNGFSGFTGTHFTEVLGDRIFPSEARLANTNIFENEAVRLDSFKRWPENAHVEPADLAKAGFYYTGLSDTVKCFTCGICLQLFEPGDDPHKEHLKYSSGCGFLQKLMLVKHTGMKSKSQKMSMQLQFGVSETNVNDTKHGKTIFYKSSLQEATNLRLQLVELYNNSSFSKLLPFPDSSHLSIDLKSIFADISVVLKDTKNQPVEQLTLPDILSHLSDITMIEGEAGSGKTALLRKIAILWASGSCPILSRFALVFYISASSIEKGQTLSNAICKQLFGSTTSLMEYTVGEIINHLGNKVLFLVDDYGIMDSGLSEALEELLQNNHINRVSLAVTVRTGNGRRLRKYARMVLSIQEFPLYSSIYIYRQLFSHDMEFLKVFLVELISSSTFQAALKSPLFAIALCIFWVENPNVKISGDATISKAFLTHTKLKYHKETKKLEAAVSLCGELALMGLFQSKFEFTESDVQTAGVDSDCALKYGLLSKFTSQRLHPIYRFFHPSFQEFLAGKRISELLESADEVQVEHGKQYLQKINTFISAATCYHYFLKYSCMHSSKTTSLIISYLFDMLNNGDAYDCPADSKLYLQHHPDLASKGEMLSLLSSNRRGFHHSFLIHMLLDFAIEVSQESGSLPECTPIILKFISGKDLVVDLQSPNMNLCRFLKEHPEAFSLINSLTLSVSRNEHALKMDFINSETFASHWGAPVVDQDYSNAFQEWRCTSGTENYYGRKHVDISKFGFGFELRPYKISVLKVEVIDHMADWEKIIRNLMVFLPLSNHIELILKDCPGFVGWMSFCIKQYKTCFLKCSIQKVELSTDEQELITQMSSLQSLEITNTHPPEHIILHLLRFVKLKELILNISSPDCEVMSLFPDENLQNIERIVFNNMNLSNHSSRLVKLIENSRNLTSFRLSCDWCPEFGKVMAAVCQNGKIQELSLCGLFITNKEIVHLASAMPSLTNLKVLEIEGSHCVDVEPLEALVHTLPSLVHLEELKLPSGPAVREVAPSIIKQFQHLRNLRDLFLTNDVLDDSSLLELAKEAKEGNLRNLRNLNLSVNHGITQSGWRDFFLKLDNMPNLNELSIIRIYTHQFKTDPTTFIALVQCVSRLHNLNKLIMHGWLLDEKDLDMFDAMKQKHPQAKSFMLMWQWILPFRPVVKE